MSYTVDKKTMCKKKEITLCKRNQPCANFHRGNTYFKVEKLKKQKRDFQSLLFKKMQGLRPLLEIYGHVQLL